MISGRWPEKKKNSLSVQNKINRTRAKDCKYNQNGQIVKTTNVRRKSKYFNEKNRLIF